MKSGSILMGLKLYVNTGIFCGGIETLNITVNECVSVIVSNTVLTQYMIYQVIVSKKMYLKVYTGILQAQI